MTTVTEYIRSAADIPEDLWLGQLVFFTISEADVDLVGLRAELVARGMRTDTLCKRLRPVDAFKKAAGEIAVKFSKAANHHHSILIRSVGQDAQTSHRHVVLERAVYASGRRRQLFYDPLATLVYDRGKRNKDGSITGDSISVTINQGLSGYTLDPVEQAWVDGHLGANGAALIDRYAHWCTHLDSHAVRAFVREYIASLDGIQAKANGGVYFVPQRHLDEVRKLAEVVRKLGSDMHLVPLLDIVDQRDMLGHAFEQETCAAIDGKMALLAKILGDPARTITQGTYDDYVNDAAALLVKADSYTDLLDRNMDEARLRITAYRTQVLTLADRIKLPKKANP